MNRTLASVFLSMMVSSALAGGVTTPVETGGSFNVPVVSLREARFQKTIHQKYDFSCGSAALATLLTHHYGKPVSEAEVFQGMFEAGNKARIQKEGFSLLDMKSYLARHGFEAEGYAVKLDALIRTQVPAVALVKENGYHHFVVIKGLRNDRILLGDPSSGTRAMSRASFEKIWLNGVLFVVRSHRDIARFNAADDWRVAPPAPVGGVMQAGAPDNTLTRRGPNDL